MDCGITTGHEPPPAEPFLIEPEPEGGFRVRCAWCHADLGPAKPDSCGHSDGICEPCRQAERATRRSARNLAAEVRHEAAL